MATAMYDAIWFGRTWNDWACSECGYTMRTVSNIFWPNTWTRRKTKIILHPSAWSQSFGKENDEEIYFLDRIHYSGNLVVLRPARDVLRINPILKTIVQKNRYCFITVSEIDGQKSRLDKYFRSNYICSWNICFYLLQ